MERGFHTRINRRGFVEKPILEAIRMHPGRIYTNIIIQRGFRMTTLINTERLGVKITRTTSPSTIVTVGMLMTRSHTCARRWTFFTTRDKHINIALSMIK
mmetsp:Transcript_2228/g.4072  ORF Transcript_2228/g.4072 Transcript_2228/m.4072 type:complete len:100 (+) Transcript_2228:1263-1562(+)